MHTDGVEALRVITALAQRALVDVVAGAGEDQALEAVLAIGGGRAAELLVTAFIKGITPLLAAIVRFQVTDKKLQRETTNNAKEILLFIRVAWKISNRKNRFVEAIVSSTFHQGPIAIRVLRAVAIA